MIEKVSTNREQIDDTKKEKKFYHHLSKMG